MLSIFSPNFINDDQSLFSADFARLFTLSDESSDGLPAPVFENPNAKSGEAWRLAGTKKPGDKKGPFSQRERSVFSISGHGKQREAIFSRMRLNSIGSIGFHRFYADRSNNSSKVLIARRLCSI